MKVAPAWEELPLAELHGLLLVVGGPDSGKSTFARYLTKRLLADGRRMAFLDGDPGQSSLGPPATISLLYALEQHGGRTGGVADLDSPLNGCSLRWFIGSNSPVRHMLPLLSGAARLAAAAREAGADTLVFDACGLIDPQQGGLALLNAQIDLLQPAALFALQRQDELEPLLRPLRRSRRARIFELQPSPAVQPRDSGARRAYRASQYRRYFADARLLWLDWTRLAVFPAPFFRLKRLAACEDQAGFCLGLGIVMEIERSKRRIGLLTPLASLEGVNALRLGDVLLDPQEFNDERIGGQ
jgi:polynucleotide 5'-hydroxyl-kinase GRC3/NOL9